MRQILSVFLLLQIFLPSMSNTQTIESIVQSETKQINMGVKNVQVTLQQTRIKIQHSSSRTDTADLFLIYEPQSRLFWWQYQMIYPNSPTSTIEGSLSDLALYINGGKIVAFTLSSGHVWVRESTERCSNIAEGQERALAIVARKKREIETGEIEWFRGISIAKAVGLDFFRLKNTASPYPEPKIKEVSIKEGMWRLLLEGPNKDSAEILLGPNYSLISATRLPGKIQ